MMVLTAAGCKKQECIGCGEMKNVTAESMVGKHYTYVMTVSKICIK